MSYWETVHSETRDDFEIDLAFCSEDIHPDDLFDWEACGNRDETLRKIDAGLLLWFTARVRVSVDRPDGKASVVIGEEYLGGCLYESVSDFLDRGYYEDMVQAALDNARDFIDSLKNAEVNND
jgi:hypothetical protein